MPFSFSPHFNPYPSRRNPVFASRGMVCASQPLAAQAGLEILKKGGNAVDAAVATAAALTVVEPTSNGIGSDLFAIIWKDGKLHGLNASGPSPAALDMDVVKARGWIGSDGRLPAHGWAAVTVPSAPAAWAELSAKFGTLKLKDNLAPAIDLAANGHAVALTCAYYWRKAYDRYNQLKLSTLGDWLDAFTRNGHPPAAGERWVSAAQASTLRRIAESEADDFYHGNLAAAIAAAAADSARHGASHTACLTKADLAGFRPEWVEPISIHYKGFDIWELPPNGQGLAALLALSILEKTETRHHDDVQTLHNQIEAMKLGFADAHAYVADPRFAAIPLEELLNPLYSEVRSNLIGDMAQDFHAGTPLPGGTVYLCAADSEGTMVSLIQSNYMGFGSGVVIPGTGISLNNRGHCFSLQAGHPNVLAPGKRPYNTIIPGFLTRHGQAVGPFGVMGGFMQPQGHLQVVMNTIDFNLNPQQALDAPRWQWLEGRKVSFEPGFNPEVVRQLRELGHLASYELDSGQFGRGQIIWKTDNATYIGATEGRTDGCVAAW